MFVRKESIRLDIEQKLDLVRQIHREQEENERYYLGRDFQGQKSQISWFASFRFRLLVAMLLFFCFFVMDKKEFVYGEMDSSKIIAHIESNMTMEELMVYFQEKYFEKF